MIKVTGYAAKHSFSRLKPLEIERDEAGPQEVEIEVLNRTGIAGGQFS